MEEDRALRALVQATEAGGSSCPVTLVLSAAIRCGRLVRRQVYLEALETLAIDTQRMGLKSLARDLREGPEEAGSFLHLVDAVLVSGGQRLETYVTSENGRERLTRRTPARVRLRDIQDWQIGSPIESAVPR